MKFRPSTDYLLLKHGQVDCFIQICHKHLLLRTLALNSRDHDEILLLAPKVGVNERNWGV